MGLDLRLKVGVKENVTTFVPITGCHFFMLENWEKGCCTVKLPVLYKLSHKSEKKRESNLFGFNTISRARRQNCL